MTTQNFLKLKLALFSTSALILAALVLVAQPSQAYYSVLDTGDVIAPGHYQAIVQPQLVFNRYDGFNFVGAFDTGLNEESSVRGLIGFGKVDFQIGGIYKWIPFPDTARQPAIGGQAGVIVARVAGDTEVSFRLSPLVSKKFSTEIGDLSAYGSLPIGLTSRSNDTTVPVQLVGGAQLTPLDNPNLSYSAELGLNVSKAFSYLSVAVAYRFDDNAFTQR